MRTRIFAGIVFFLLSHAVFCQQKTNIGLLRGMPSVVFSGMFSNESYEFTFYDSAQELVKAMKDGFVDASNVPASLAEKVAEHSEGKLLVPAVTSNTDVALVTTDENVHFFSDLLGKKVYVVKDSFEERFFRSLLSLSAIPVKTGESSIEIESMNSFSALVSGLVSGKITCAVLSEPYVSSALVSSPLAFSAVDFQDEYVKIYGNGKTIPKTVLLVLRQYRDGRRKDYSKFLEDVKNSVYFVNAHPGQSAGACKKKKVMLPVNSAARSIKNSHFVYQETDENFRLMMYN